jgi:hypothetical protein
MRLLAATFIASILAVPFPATAAAEPMCDSPPCTRAEIEAYEARVVRHLLRVQQERFEAHSRGDKKQATRYDREFNRTQDRRAVARRAIEGASN